MWYGAAEFTIAGCEFPRILRILRSHELISVYTNSLLVTLNSRNIVRHAGEATNQASYGVPLSRLGVKDSATAGGNSAFTPNSSITANIPKGSYPSDVAIGIEFRRADEHTDEMNI